VWLRFADPTQGDGNGRFAIWQIGWDAFRTHWLTGSGAGDFRDAYTAAFLKAYQMGESPPMVQDAHNMIVSTSVELGLIGLILLFAAWFFQFRTVSTIARSSRLFDLRLAAEAGTIGLCFTALTVDILYFKYLWIGFMIAALIRNASVCEQEAIHSRPATAGYAMAAH
jgi:O-antigen ligase